MSEILVILTLLLFGQLGDRYLSADDASVLPPDYSEEANSSPTDQPTQNPAATESTSDQAELFEDAPQESPEQNAVDSTTETHSPSANESPAVQLPNSTTENVPPATTGLPNTSTEVSPEKVLGTFSEPVVGSQLSGTPVALTEVIASSSTRREQTQRVEAYWSLSQAVLDYNLALKEKVELAALRRNIAQAGPQWDNSLKLAESREQLALRAARVAQQRVAEALGLTSEDLAPLPSDLPFVGTYNTRFTELFPQLNGNLQGQIPRLAKEYDEYLTSAAEVLKNEAQEISDAREWMFAVDEQRSPNTDGKELLAAYDLFAANRRLFVQTIGDYNREIVRYTELATPGNVEPQRLVAMLIRVEGTPTSKIDSEVRRASAEEAASQQRSTPENSWHALPNNAERSILVPRR